MEFTYEDITYHKADRVARITINRPDAANMFRAKTLHEMKAALEDSRLDDNVRVVVISGAGEKFFCIGGDKSDLPKTHAYKGVIPVMDVYDLMDKLPKPVIAAVDGFAVGGGNVLHVVCDFTIATDRSVFRQVGPMMGSFDAGYGTWYLEDLVGKKRAKDMWYRNPKINAHEALDIGLINKVVPDDELTDATLDYAMEIASRGAFALASIKAAFNARHGGVGGLSRMAHDLLLRGYLTTEESKELSSAFSERRAPDTDVFGH